MTRTRRNPSRKTQTSDPRKTPRPESADKKGNKKRIDKLSLILALCALVLLILVILFFNRRISGAVFLSDSQAPVIERVETVRQTQEPKEPLVDLSPPEPPTLEPAVAPIEENSPPKSGSVEEANARLFFVRVNNEGQISMKSVLRPVPMTQSPLTVAINSLVDGPKPGELSNDVLSLIPEGSRMLGARIENGVAWLDFNENFRFNTLGIEGYRAQVEQVVYTATEFPTVNKVQFLIEGQRIDYLGGEGFWVGAPLGRNDF